MPEYAYITHLCVFLTLSNANGLRPLVCMYVCVCNLKHDEPLIPVIQVLQLSHPVYSYDYFE